MNQLNKLIIILIFGFLILLTFLLIVNPLKVNKKANLWFGVFTILWSSFWLEEISMLTNYSLMNSISLTQLHFIQFLTPIVFYFSVVYYTNPDFKFQKKDFGYCAVPSVYLIGLIIKELYLITWIPILLHILIITHAIYYTIYSYIKIQHHKKRIRLFASNTEEIDLKWIEYIIIALFVMSIFIGAYNLIFEAVHLNLFANIISLLIISFVAVNTLKQKEIFLINKKERVLIIKNEEQTLPEKTKIISDEDLYLLKDKLVNLMKDEKPYLDPELTLIRLADLIKISPHQLSYVINAGFNENFFLFVNKYRVDRVKELLLDKKYSHLSILGIAFDSGFNSKTSFNTTFKKISLQTPTEFKKNSTNL